MKRKTLILIIASFAVVIVLISILISLTIKNSKDCDQFVIDTFELTSGIDIPKQTDSKCYYDSNAQIRVGIYSINNISDFINANGLQKIDKQENKTLWSNDLLVENVAVIPDSTADLFGLAGNHNGDLWQCFVDTKTGNMWFEIKWKK